MKKETLTAVVFGIILGGVLGFFLITKNKEKSLEKTKTFSPKISITPVAKANNSDFQFLEVDEPSTGTITGKNTITLKGKAPANSLIIIQTPIRDIALQNEKGIFVSDIPLALGENSIHIAIYPKDTQIRVQEKDLKIFYLNEKL